MDRIITCALVVGSSLLAMPLAAAQTTIRSSSETDFSFERDIDIPRDNLIAALALGLRGPSALERIANIHVEAEFSSEVSRDVDLDEDDVFLLLALRGSGLRGSTLLLFDDDHDLFDDDDFDDWFDHHWIDDDWWD